MCVLHVYDRQEDCCSRMKMEQQLSLVRAATDYLKSREKSDVDNVSEAKAGCLGSQCGFYTSAAVTPAAGGSVLSDRLSVIFFVNVISPTETTGRDFSKTITFFHE